jgi:hypothetical protein
MATSTAEGVAVRFTLYGCPELPLPIVARRVAHALAVPLESRTSSLCGVYYRWTGYDVADVLVQGNVIDEDGALLEPGYHASAALVYATGLDEAGYDALALVEGLELLDSEVLLVR